MFWDHVAGLYDLFQRSNQKAVRDMAEETACRIPEKARMLKCAAGTGVITLAAAPRADYILCTDLSLPMLEQARQKTEDQGFSHIEFAQRDIFHLPEADGSFDVVCAANVLHLLDDPAPAVRELWRVTAPGGQLILPTFLMGETGTLMRILIWLYHLIGFQQKHRFTRQSYKTFFEHQKLPLTELAVIPGRLPVGLAILQKPVPREGSS